jgi:hypothetical protein
MNDTKNWLNGFTTSTAGQYIVAMAATWLAAKMGLDPTTGQANIAAILVQIIGLIPAVWGVIQSARNKIVVANKVVAINKLTETDKEAVVQIVAKKTDTPASELREAT